MRSKLQEKPAALKREHPTLHNMTFLDFFSIFVGHFCPSGSGSNPDSESQILDPAPLAWLNPDPKTLVFLKVSEPSLGSWQWSWSDLRKGIRESGWRLNNTWWMVLPCGPTIRTSISRNPPLFGFLFSRYLNLLSAVGSDWGKESRNPDDWIMVPDEWSCRPARLSGRQCQGIRPPPPRTWDPSSFPTSPVKKAPI